MNGRGFGSAQAGGPLSDPPPGRYGLRYDPPDRPATVSEAQAIQAAKVRVGPRLAGEATKVVARYVLLSDDKAYRTDAQGQKHYLWQKVPVWVVTFDGVNYYPPGGAPSRPGEPPRQLLVMHQLNVVIDAQTGAVQSMFVHTNNAPLQ